MCSDPYNVIVHAEDGHETLLVNMWLQSVNLIEGICRQSHWS